MSFTGSSGAFFAVEVGRVVHFETSASTVAYLDCCSEVRGFCVGILDSGNGYGMGVLSGPEDGRRKSSLVSLALFEGTFDASVLLAGVS